MADEPEDESSAHVEVPEGDPGRRRFLKLATCGVGVGLGAVIAVPAARYLLYPVGKRIVTAGADPIEVANLRQLPQDGRPVQVRVVASSIRDGWSSVNDVPLGSAWLRRIGDREVQALSAVCPHLGCAVAFDPASTKFKCPCHESAFDPTGKRLSGPAERGLDELPVEPIGQDGRVRLTWIRYRSGGGSKVPT